MSLSNFHLMVVSKARECVQGRINRLLPNGPVNKSTLSGMIFASDDEEGTQTGKKLSRNVIIGNALIYHHS